MLKKILRFLGITILVITLGFGAIISCTVYQSSKYDKIILPKLAAEMPLITSWEYEKLTPLLSESAQEAFGSEKGQKILRSFAKLGALDYFEPAEFRNVNTEAHTGRGTTKTITYSMLGHFENGDANMTIVFLEDGDSHKIQYIHLNSEVFLD